jgi:phasin family protein
MITETAKKMTEEATKVAEQAKAQTETFVGEFQTRAKAAAEKGQEFAKDAVEFSRGNVEAIVESAKIAAKGAEVIGSELAAFAKQSVEDTTVAAKRYAAVKTPAEFLALQTELSRSALDTMVKQGAKTSELTVKLANDAFAPISNRIALAVSKLKAAA